uniref:Immunoglobulin domain-containing protein n=1 Tax=Sinocyclocheilus anshuiensis TaxID=1608454 RepID=A0A671NLW4_9TELE
MGDAADPVPAITGGSVIINCMYNRENAKTSAKSFCKMSGSECTTMTEEKNDLWIPEERFSMTDDKTLGLISVLIRNLTVNDSGMYRCKDGSEWFQEVKFNSCCGTSEKQTAYILGTAVIHCKYPEKYKDHLKQLYKVQNGSLLSIHIVGSSTTNERFSLNINEQEHVLTVTIAYVSRHDDGVYFCGIYNNLIYTPLFSEIRLHVSGESTCTLTSYVYSQDKCTPIGIMKLKLLVSESCCGTSEEQTAYILGTAVIHCKYPEKYKDHLKQLYKVQNGSLLSIHIVGSSTTNERFSLNINEQEHVLTVTIAYVSRHDDGVYFCGIYNNLIYTPLFSEIRLHVSGESTCTLTFCKR